jgi:hypothetical protein
MPFRLSIVCNGGADRFPTKVCDLDAEKIRDDQTYLPINQLTKRAHSFLLKWLGKARKQRFCGNPGVHQVQFHRSGSSRSISSLLEGKGPGEGVRDERNFANSAKAFRRELSTLSVGMFHSSNLITSAAIERRWLRARLRSAS